MFLRLWSAVLIAKLASSISDYQISNTGCPVGWEYFSSFCYGVFREEGDFHDARSHCSSYSGSLVSFWSQADWDFITNHQNVSDSSFWIGRRKVPYKGDKVQLQNGTWIAIDHSKNTFYVEWANDADPGVVVTNQTQCVAAIINVSTGGAKAWPRDCSHSVEAFVCKKPLPFVFEMGSAWIDPLNSSPSGLRVLHRTGTSQASHFFRVEDVRPFLTNSTILVEKIKLNEGIHQCAALCLLYRQCTYFVSNCTTSSGCETFHCRLFTFN